MAAKRCTVRTSSRGAVLLEPVREIAFSHSRKWRMTLLRCGTTLPVCCPKMKDTLRKKTVRRIPWPPRAAQHAERFQYGAEINLRAVSSGNISCSPGTAKLGLWETNFNHVQKIAKKTGAGFFVEQEAARRTWTCPFRIHLQAR